MFYFDGCGTSPASDGLMSNLLKETYGFGVPSTESFDDQWLEGDALSPAAFEVETVFGGFACFNGSGGFLSSAKDNVLLGGRGDADVECHFSSVNKVPDINVRWAGNSAITMVV